MESFPKTTIRLTTRKGKDVVKLIDGRWGEVISETDEKVIALVEEKKYVGDQGPYRAYGIYFVLTGKKEELTIHKLSIDDKRKIKAVV